MTSSQQVRELGIADKVMLCAFGIHADGTKELLSFRLADVEDTASWQGFLIDLKSRGLKGTAVKLIPVDGNPALLKALRRSTRSGAFSGAAPTSSGTSW